MNVYLPAWATYLAISLGILVGIWWGDWLIRQDLIKGEKG